MTIQPSRLLEQRDRLARDEQQPAEVDAELQVDVLRLQRLDLAADADARRVDEHVQAAEPLCVLGDDADAVLLLAHVGGDRLRAELGGGRLDLLAGARGERQLEALLAEHARDREPDARRASGDECARASRPNLEENVRPCAKRGVVVPLP